MKKTYLIVVFICVVAELNAQWTTPSSGTTIYTTDLAKNVGIGTSLPGFKLTVKGNTSIGDDYDPIDFGLLQITRAYSRPDNKFHLSFVQNGHGVSGMGYAPNSNTLGIWHFRNDNIGQPTLSFTTDQKIGIGTLTPLHKLDVQGNIYSTGTIYIDGGDLELSRTTHPYGYVTRPNVAGYKNLQFAVTGGDPLERIVLHSDMSFFTGNVGIGTNSPAAKLEVNGNSILGSSTQGSSVIINDIPDARYSINTGNYNLTFSQHRSSDNTFVPRFIIANGGNVGIGTSNTSDPEYKLFVEAGVRTRKVKVDQATWPDYVFDKNYKLLALQELDRFIAVHKHLPDVPSAADVKKDGLNLGDNQAVLLKKIEELTLYIIAQQKQIDEMKKLIQQGKN